MNGIWKYNALLPFVPKNDRITLGEGQTPLIRSRSIGKKLGLSELYFKLENLNPTGSYKDRFAAVLVSLMSSRRQNVCIATSSGNTGAALSAYCASAGIQCILVVVDGAPAAKIKQMQLYGAVIYTVKGFGKDVAVTEAVFKLLEDLTMKMNLPLPISAYRYCTVGMQGVQTLTYEILEETKSETGHIFSPAGGGGLTLSVIRGIKEYGERYKPRDLPKVHCVQPEGNDTIAGPLRNGKRKAQAVPQSTTHISGLQIPGIIDGNDVVKELPSLCGYGYTVKDEEVFEWQQRLAQEEGIFCEPAGAVALAGLAAAVQKQEVLPAESAVCLVTGSGFKDFRSVERNFKLPEMAVLPDINALEQTLITL